MHINRRVAWLVPEPLLSRPGVFSHHAPKSGTSGLRGLVTEPTPELDGTHTKAFLQSCPHGQAVHVGHDLRPSSPATAGSVITTKMARTEHAAVKHGELGV